MPLRPYPCPVGACGSGWRPALWLGLGVRVKVRAGVRLSVRLSVRVRVSVRGSVSGAGEGEGWLQSDGTPGRSGRTCSPSAMSESTPAGGVDTHTHTLKSRSWLCRISALAGGRRHAQGARAHRGRIANDGVPHDHLVEHVGLRLVLGGDVHEELLHVPVPHGAQVGVDAEREDRLPRGVRREVCARSEVRGGRSMTQGVDGATTWSCPAP